MYTRLPPVCKRLKRSSDTELPLPTAPIRMENGLKSTQYSDGRLAQLVRAPALQAGGPRFEPATAHQPMTLCPVPGRVYPLRARLAGSKNQAACATENRSLTCRAGRARPLHRIVVGARHASPGTLESGGSAPGRSVFHGVSRAEGPSQQTTQCDGLPHRGEPPRWPAPYCRGML